MNQAYMDIGIKLSNSFNDNAYWFEFYGDSQEKIMPNEPLAYGNPVEINSYINANHSVGWSDVFVGILS